MLVPSGNGRVRMPRIWGRSYVMNEGCTAMSECNLQNDHCESSNNEEFTGNVLFSMSPQAVPAGPSTPLIRKSRKISRRSVRHFASMFMLVGRGADKNSIVSKCDIHNPEYARACETPFYPSKLCEFRWTAGYGSNGAPITIPQAHIWWKFFEGLRIYKRLCQRTMGMASNKTRQRGD